jgi:hypothetical protein
MCDVIEASSLRQKDVVAVNIVLQGVEEHQEKQLGNSYRAEKIADGAFTYNRGLSPSTSSSQEVLANSKSGQCRAEKGDLR